MRTLKLFSLNLNAQIVELPPTSIGTDGSFTSIKKDGNFITGRNPLLEEKSLLWRYTLTSQEKLKGNNNRLFSKIYVPEEGIDFKKSEDPKDPYKHATDEQKRMINLCKFVMNHQYVQRFENPMVNGERKRTQMNKHFGRNSTLVFELVDETANEEIEFNKERLVTKCLGMVDEIFDLDHEGTEQFMDMCFGMNVSGCYKNVKKRNYNLLTDKIRLSPEGFLKYWEDPDRPMVITINKGKKLGGDRPYITQDSNGCYFYKEVLLGSSEAELKLYFKNNPDEYEYLKRAVGEPVSMPVKTPEPKSPQVGEKPTGKPDYTPPEGRVKNPMTTKNTMAFAQMNKEVGFLLGLTQKARNDGNQKGLANMRDRLKRDREKWAEHLEYFNNRLAQESAKKGIAVEEVETVSVA